MNSFVLDVLPLFQAVLEKQSYMLIGRHDIDKLMQLEPASVCLPNAFGQSNFDNYINDVETSEVEQELSDLLLNLRPIKQVCLLLFDVASSLFCFRIMLFRNRLFVIACYLFCFQDKVVFLRFSFLFFFSPFGKGKSILVS